MDIERLKVGQTRRFSIKSAVGVTEGKGVIQAFKETKTGTRVVLYDKTRMKTFTARPSQVLA